MGDKDKPKKPKEVKKPSPDWIGSTGSDELPETSTTSFSVTNEEIVLGRDPDCERVLPSPVISRRHFALSSHKGGFSVQGLHAGDGLFVNGEPVKSQELKRGDRVRVGPYVFTFNGAAFTEQNEFGRMSLVASDLGKKAGKFQILSDISFVAKPQEFVGVLGPSGAGKTTLLNCLHGYHKPNSGQVLVNGEDLSSAFHSLKVNLGFVPQDDIIHRDLRVEDALLFTARLRLPGDTSRRERKAIVAEILESVELQHRARARIRTLSGGERKRVNLAVELVTRPSLLYLDEPTSGLDPATERKLMKLFRRLANEGRTVILTTHVMENVDLLDQIVVLNEGRLVFYGPPGRALESFEIDRMTQLYERLEIKKTETWAAEYIASKEHQTLVTDRLEKAQPLLAPKKRRRKRPRHRPLSQLLVLLHRYLATILGDPMNLLYLILPGPLIGLLATVPLDSASRDDQFKLLFFLTITAIFCGCFNSFREIVKERAIYNRERMVNLGILPYVLSKLILHATVLLVECGLLLLAVVAFEDVGGRLPFQYLLLWTAAVASCALGLLVSSLVRTSEKAVGLLILAVLPQIIFSGGLARLSGISEQLANFVIAYWSFDGLLEVAYEQGKGLGEVAMLGAHTGAYLVLTAVALFILEKRKG